MKSRIHPLLSLLSLLLPIFLSTPLLAAEPPLASLGNAGKSGVLVHVGAEDGSLAIAAATAGPVVVLALTPDNRVDALRETVLQAGLAGQITVLPLVANVPLADGVATAVVVSGGAVPRLELERVLGVRGALIEPGKPAWTKPVPKEFDEWPQYFRDGAASDVSQDLALKPIQGVQWQAGTMNTKLSATDPSVGLRIAGGVLLHSNENRLVARDARNGMPLWERKDRIVSQQNRYAFLADAATNRVWLLPKRDNRNATGPWFQVALDLTTGADAGVLDQGIDVSGGSTERGVPSKADSFQVRYDRGFLLQASLNQLVMLDAATGRRLWVKDSPTGWWTPVLADGTVYVVEGPGVPSASYTHWPMGRVDAVVAFDAATGKEHWRFAWPAGERAISAYNMTLHQGQLALACRLEGRLKEDGPNLDRARLLVLDASTGAQKHFVDLASGDGLGKGHSHIRVMGMGDRWWINGIGAEKTLAIANPADKSQWRGSAGGRPAGCQVWRLTPEFLIGASTLVGVEDNAVHLNTASRTACDIGAFPADGLLFQGENHCWCKSYLMGVNAMHGRTWPTKADAEQLVRGPGTAAPGGADASDATDTWPQYLQSPWRGSWNKSVLGGELTEIWRINAEDQASKAHESLRRDWEEYNLAQSPTITGVSQAEGIAVFARIQQGIVVAIDPATGKERWHAALDGRIDSQPTIHQGLVLVGTASGWVNALSRADGRLVWRYRAAPHEALIGTNGQLGSVWPVTGAVTITKRGALVLAGRHSEMDGGLFWSLLEPATGKLLASGVISSSTEDRENNRVGVNMPPVSDGEHVFLANLLYRFEGNTLMPFQANIPESDKGKKVPAWRRTRHIPLVQPKLSTLVQYLPKTGYNKDSYAGTLSRQFIYRPGTPDFFDMGGTGGGNYGGRGGGSEALLTRLKRLDSITTTGPKNEEIGAEKVWQATFPRALGEIYGLRVAAASADRVLVGLTEEGSKGKSGPNLHYLQVLDIETGQQLQQLPLPAPPAVGGISIAGKRVIVACVDGSIVGFAAK